MQYSSPLRYPGGKSRLTNFIKSILIKNRLKGGHYVEPYAGGAGVALFLVYDDFVKHAHINDIDPAIHAFWVAATQHTKELCRKILATDVSVEEWDRQKEALLKLTEAVESGEEVSDVELGFAAFFLNRTNRSGILSAGMIGGRAQDAKYRIDARFNKENLVQRIERVGQFRDRISVHRRDAAKLIEETSPNWPDRTFIYLDPPYYEKAERLYVNHYEDCDHARVVSCLQSVSHKWLVSYDNVPRIRELYDSFAQQEYSLSYSAQKKYDGAEIMIFSEGLKVPDCESPLDVSKEDISAQLIQAA